MPQQVKKSLVLSIYLVLIVSALLVFWQVRNFGFVDYDDGSYVYENPHVLNGLTADNVIWAFTTGYCGNWNPLTWLSYMLDWQLFGSNPAGFHLINFRSKYKFGLEIRAFCHVIKHSAISVASIK